MGELITPARTDMLADLAPIWVERWLAHGGSLIVDASADNISMGMGCWRHQGQYQWQRTWHDGWNVGRWRELSELAALVPGLREAIIHFVALTGEPTESGGWIVSGKKPSYAA